MAKVSKNDLMVALTRAYEQGDLSFLETVSSVTFGYKSELKRRLNQEDDAATRMD